MLRKVIVIINNKANYIGEARNNEEALFSAESYTRTNFIGNTDDITQVETQPDKDFIFVVNSTLYEWVES